MYQPFDIAQYLFVSGMMISAISGISLILQLQKSAGNPTWDIIENRKELEDAFSKENAKKFKLSYFGARFGPILIFFGVIFWFVEKFIRLN